MNPLLALFNQKKENILNVYCTAGYPKLNSTTRVIDALQSNGVDIVEIGMPYSDPLADGDTIQQSSSIALQNGMRITVLLNQLNEYKPKLSVPLILMGYMNPLLQYGFAQFCAQAKQAGVCGLIIPDMPLTEYIQQYQSIMNEHELCSIFLVTPNTSKQRVLMIDGLTNGFIYAVSSSSTTGSTQDFEAVQAYLLRLKSYELRNPILVGFGISTAAQYKQVCTVANGGIIGTAYIKALAQSSDIELITHEYIHSIRGSKQLVQ